MLCSPRMFPLFHVYLSVCSHARPTAPTTPVVRRPPPVCALGRRQIVALVDVLAEPSLAGRVSALLLAGNDLSDATFRPLAARLASPACAALAAINLAGNALTGAAGGGGAERRQCSIVLQVAMQGGAATLLGV